MIGVGLTIKKAHRQPRSADGRAGARLRRHHLDQHDQL